MWIKSTSFLGLLTFLDSVFAEYNEAFFGYKVWPHSHLPVINIFENPLGGGGGKQMLLHLRDYKLAIVMRCLVQS